jgi:cellulose synthase/poly-beta-1,6-N-acetylglucosamine synthase-like glycosyltransferase
MGEIVVCLDADTIAPPDLLKIISLEYGKDSSLVGLTGIVDGCDGNFLQRFFYKWISTLFVRLSFLLGKPGFQGQSFSFRKEAFFKVGGFNTKLYTGEDLDLGCRLAKIGKIKFLPKVVGTSSVRRFKEGVFKSVSRGFLSYLAVIWKIPLAQKEKEPFPSIR